MLTRIFRLLSWLHRAPSPAAAPPSIAEGASRLKSKGNALLAEGRIAAAAAVYRQAIALAPNAAELYVNLGFALKEQGLLEQAERPLRRAAELDPALFDARYLFGMVLAAIGQVEAAVVEFQAALALRPDFTAGHAEIGKLLLQTGQVERAKQLMQEAVDRNPGQASFHMLLGNLHAHSREVAQAVACFEQAIAIEPSFTQAHNNLGLVLEKQGRLNEAIATFRKAVALAPTVWESRSNLLFALSYDPDTSPEAYLDEALQCGQALLSSARPCTDWPQATPRPAGALRVGLLSGDFRVHPVGYFLEGLLAAWGSTRIELYAYSANPADDSLTERLKPHFDGWRSIFLADDETLARLIQEDGIQVLVDLAGHTDNSRLPVLAWKPAPVQASWLGFFASTGLPTVDWFLADPVSVPTSHHSHFCEAIWPLPATRLCFTAPTDDLLPGPLPALTMGHVTFGCFQVLTKVNDGVLQVWAAILRALPQARLRMQCMQLDDASLRDRFLQRCEASGLDTSRLVLCRSTSRQRYLAAHHEVDIMLDTFPYSGATTTCESLWMGVPTLTLAGDRLIARQGASVAVCLGLEDWVAENTTDYVERALRHVSDLHALAQLRAALRERLLASPLCDAPCFARHLQAALVGMWDAYVNSAQRNMPMSRGENRPSVHRRLKEHIHGSRSVD